jgi:hypothetical protein
MSYHTLRALLRLNELDGTFETVMLVILEKRRRHFKMDFTSPDLSLIHSPFIYSHGIE